MKFLSEDKTECLCKERPILIFVLFCFSLVFQDCYQAVQKTTLIVMQKLQHILQMEVGAKLTIKARSLKLN